MQEAYLLTFLMNSVLLVLHGLEQGTAMVAKYEVMRVEQNLAASKRILIVCFGTLH
jgi:hypothetical protein